MDELSLALFVLFFCDERFECDSSVAFYSAFIGLLLGYDCGHTVRNVPVAIRNLKQQAYRRQFARECLLKSGTSVIASVAATILHNQIAPKGRRENVLVSELDA